MSTVAGIRELKTHTSELVRRVREQGETIDITYYGEVVARIVPVKSATQVPAEPGAQWADIDRLAAQIGAQWPDDVSAAEAVAADRREL